jgi:hypothetical protein
MKPIANFGLPYAVLPSHDRKQLGLDATQAGIHHHQDKQMIKIHIKTADVCEVNCDVLILKYAQDFYGADAAVASALSQYGRLDIEMKPQPQKHVILKSDGIISARWVLTVGVVPLNSFDYSEIRAFTRRSLAIVSSSIPNARNVAMTMHGAGYGLDERESFLSQLGGIADALSEGISELQISIVERNAARAERMRLILHDAWPRASSQIAAEFASRDAVKPVRPITAGAESRSKPHVFVAMPFSKDLEDVFVFGIQSVINNAGYLCERVDMASFTGDILERIKSRIETSALVVADLTGASPNVYLEVGYAWGKNRPTLLLARKSDELKFDVRGQRCIVYENIVDLEKRLKRDIALLLKNDLAT